MRVTLLGCEQNISIFYVRDKEAYFTSWNVVKVVFNNPRREFVSGENPTVKLSWK